MDTSETSTTEDKDDLSADEKNVRIFATQMLKNRIFLGHFQEKRYVEPIHEYRDVIVLNNSENKLKKDIDIVRKRLRNFYGPDYWIGLTDPNFIGTPYGHCIWIESDNQPLGQYLYKIKGFRFRRNEIILRVKNLRSMTDDDNFTTNQSSNDLSAEDILRNYIDNFSIKATMDNIKNIVSEYLLWFFTILTVKNIKEAITFVSLLIFTITAFSIQGIKFFMEYTLKFMHEFSFFIQSATPVMIAVVNLIGKIIGGFYLLILMIWRGDKPRSQNKYTPYNAIEMPRYNSRSSVTIREIE